MDHARHTDIGGSAMPEIHVYSTAREMAAAVAGKEISARELLDLHLDRIAAVNPAVNAVVSLDEERAREGPRPPTRRSLTVSRSARCTAFRTRSRTPTRSVAGVRRSAPRCARTTCPGVTS
jgi:Asp-tRNA(Asn)/Glu-tRNA(Gln) amidotransferase A subunit family amidase